MYMHTYIHIHVWTGMIVYRSLLSQILLVRHINITNMSICLYTWAHGYTHTCGCIKVIHTHTKHIPTYMHDSNKKSLHVQFTYKLGSCHSFVCYH